MKNTTVREINVKIYKYTRLDKNWIPADMRIVVIDRQELADGAKNLYLFLAGYRPNGSDMSVQYIRKSLSLGQSTYEKYIRQLKNLGLVDVQRKGPKMYECYIGTLDVSASTVKDYWKELNSGDAIGPITKSQLDEIRENYNG